MVNHLMGGTVCRGRRKGRSPQPWVGLVRRLFAARFLRRFRLNNSMTIIFAHPYVNAGGILVLDLKKTIAVPPKKRYTIGL